MYITALISRGDSGIVTLYVTVPLCTAQAGLRLQTLLQPTQPLDLALCGVPLLTTQWTPGTPVGWGTCCLYSVSTLGQEIDSRRADTAVADGIVVFSRAARDGFPRKFQSLEPLRHSSSVQALYKEGGSPRCPQQAWDTVPLPCDQKLCPCNRGRVSISFQKGYIEMTKDQTLKEMIFFLKNPCLCCLLAFKPKLSFVMKVVNIQMKPPNKKGSG